MADLQCASSNITMDDKASGAAGALLVGVSVLTLNDSYTAILTSHCSNALELSSLLITEGAGGEAAADD